MANFLKLNKTRQKRDNSKNLASSEVSDYYDNPEKLTQKFLEKTKGGWTDVEFLYSVKASRVFKRSQDTEAILALFYATEEAKIIFAPFECLQSVELGIFMYCIYL